MTFEQFMSRMYDGSIHAMDYNGQRLGQWFFQYLKQVRTDIADEMCGTEYDPFHKEYISQETLQFVKARW